MKFALVKVIVFIVKGMDLELYQIDVNTTLFNGELKKYIYMSQPEGLYIKRQEETVSPICNGI